jgi:hypothetical protein
LAFSGSGGLRQYRNTSTRHRRNNRDIRPKQASVNRRANEIQNLPELAMTFLRPACSAAVLALLAFSTIPATPAPMPASKPSFDGAWSVLIVTQKGTCDRAYRYPVKIENGAVGYAGSASFTVSGKVDGKGAVIVTVARGSQSATGTGRMSDSDGSGIWTAGSGECSGTWTAERRS